MRPEPLNPLFASASCLPGVGAKLERTIAKLIGRAEAAAPAARVIDLLLHLPSGLIDRRVRPLLADLPEAGIVTVEVTVGRHRPSPPHNRRAPYRVECFDDTGALSLVFFHAYPDHMAKLLPEGEQRFVSGPIGWFQSTPQMVHPDHVLTKEQFERMPLLEPVYPLTAGLSPKVLHKALGAALQRVPQLAEWQDPAWLRARDWPGFAEALGHLHRPPDAAVLEAGSAARMRLAYDELLANQLALRLVRRHMRKKPGRRITGSGELRQRILARLPFSLTQSQQQAAAEIAADMAGGTRMLRLLQGDVGSGKTVVALLALATAAEAGLQGAVMAPTEILARQHAATLRELAAPAGLQVELLTGRERGGSRGAILSRLEAGETSIVVGTHALLQEDVTFRDLGLVVIDEQHRFGVRQRLALQQKSPRPVDLLVMSATPIPRTLTLTLYGDMDVSRLTEKPAGRKPVETRALPSERLEEVAMGLARPIGAGAQVYWVCPLVEETGMPEVSAAQERHAQLERLYPHRVGLVHGRMKAAEKDVVMRRFAAGDLAVLVSTTVIEVGVDIAAATVMVIENAERFGLAQLHQLRGRVGRGDKPASCVLVYQPPLGETARERLKVLRNTDDGFVIAEEDLRLRGSGEVLGARQSGLPMFRVADPVLHRPLLEAASNDAALILERDPDLAMPRGEALRALLYLFEKDAAVRLLAAG